MKTGAIGTECKLRARWGDRPPVAGDVMRSESQRARLGYEILDVRRIEPRNNRHRYGYELLVRRIPLDVVGMIAASGRARLHFWKWDKRPGARRKMGDVHDKL